MLPVPLLLSALGVPVVGAGPIPPALQRHFAYVVALDIVFVLALVVICSRRKHGASLCILWTVLYAVGFLLIVDTAPPGVGGFGELGVGMVLIFAAFAMVGLGVLLSILFALVFAAGAGERSRPRAHTENQIRGRDVTRDEAGTRTIRCRRCGHDAPSDALLCPNCNLSFRANKQAPARNGYAIASLVLGFPMWLCVGPLATVPNVLAVVLGVIALKHNRRVAAQGGVKWPWAVMACLGIVLGTGALVYTIILLVAN